MPILFRDLTEEEMQYVLDSGKDTWGRTRTQVWRIYGKERCLKEWGDRLPEPKDIIEYKKNWVKKAWKSRQYIKCTPYANTAKVTRWLRNYGINRLDYDNVYKDTIVVRDPHTFVILKLYFSEQNG